MLRINGMTRVIVAATLFFVLFVFTPPVSAVTYKWRDDKGVFHFTDDLDTIPLPYRSKPSVEIVEGMDEPPSLSKPSPSDGRSASETKGEKPGKKAELTKAEKDKIAAERKKLEAEKPLLQEAIAHLESEIQRNERLIEAVPPTMINGKYFVAGIQQSLPAKKALTEKIGKSELPALVAAREFLQPSVAQDTQEKVSENAAVVNQAAQLSDRLKSELPALKQLVEQLRSELVSVEQTLSVPAPPVVEGTKEKQPEETTSESAVIKEESLLEDKTDGEIESEIPKE